MIEWIPVAERLPANDDCVIITLKDLDNDKIETLFGYYDPGDGCWLDYESCIVDDYACEVVAWMPFPDPYKEVLE